MSFRYLLRLSLICLFVISLILGSANQYASVHAAAQSAPAAQTDPEAQLDAILDAEPNITEDFSTLSELWDTHYDGETATYFKAGRYHVSVNAEDLIAWGTADISAGDFLVEVDMSHYDGPLDNRGGLIFRYVDSDNFYSFSVSSDGYYSLRKLEDDEWETLIEWTESEVVNTGERTTNRVGVLAEGASIALIVNGTVVAEVEDSSFAEGAVGLMAGTFEEYEVDIAFDDFSLWELPLAEQPERVPFNPSGRLTPRTSESDLTIEERIDLVRQSTPVLSEDFSSGAGEWDTESNDETLIAVDDGALQIEVFPVDWVSYSGIEGEYDDFLLELDVSHVSGPTAVEYGTYFRNSDGDNYYYFAVSATGQYNFWKRLNGEWTEILPWTAADSLNAGIGARNRIGVLADGQGIALLANDTVLAEVKDESFAGGSVGVFLRTYDAGDAAVAFDNLDVWDLRTAGGGEVAVEIVPVAEVDLDKVEERLEDIRKEEPLVSEDFRVDNGAWSMESTDDVLFEFSRRTFHVSVDKPDWLAWSRYERAELDDFFMEGEVEVVESPLDGSYGLLFRTSDVENFYVFRISPRGTYSLMKKAGGEWTTLVDWTTSDLIDTSDGAVNRIGVLADGPTIAGVINGEVVTALEDADLTSGRTALVVATYGDAGVEVAFDNVDIWQLGD